MLGSLRTGGAPHEGGVGVLAALRDAGTALRDAGTARRPVWRKQHPRRGPDPQERSSQTRLLCPFRRSQRVLNREAFVILVTCVYEL